MELKKLTLWKNFYDSIKLVTFIYCKPLECSILNLADPFKSRLTKTILLPNLFMSDMFMEKLTYGLSETATLHKTNPEADFKENVENPELFESRLRNAEKLNLRLKLAIKLEKDFSRYLHLAPTPKTKSILKKIKATNHCGLWGFLAPL